MRKIIKTHILGMLIVALIATQSCAGILTDLVIGAIGAVIGASVSGSSNESDKNESDKSEDYVPDGFLQVARGNNGTKYYVHEDVKKVTKTVKSGNVFNKKTTEEVFYIGYIYSSFVSEDDKGAKYSVEKIIVPESENKIYTINSTCYKKEGEIVEESPESEWRNLDWSKIEELSPNTLGYALISKVQELGRSQ